VPLSCAKAGVAQSKAKAAQIKVLASGIGAPPIRSYALRSLANGGLIRNPLMVSRGDGKAANHVGRGRTAEHGSSPLMQIEIHQTISTHGEICHQPYLNFTVCQNGTLWDACCDRAGVEQS
jgi:hypothetical protein